MGQTLSIVRAAITVQSTVLFRTALQQLQPVRYFQLFYFTNHTNTSRAEGAGRKIWRIVKTVEHIDVQITLKRFEGQHQALEDYREGKIRLVESREKVRRMIMAAYNLTLTLIKPIPLACSFSVRFCYWTGEMQRNRTT